jgi:hypothetical protein
LYEKIPSCSTPSIVPSFTLTVVVRGVELHAKVNKIETINTKKQPECFDLIASPFDVRVSRMVLQVIDLIFYGNSLFADGSIWI